MGKSVNGNAVRIYTLNERATKFRNTAACLSWGEKTGSAEKKAYILGLLPEGATDTRSLGRDLSKEQQEELIAANKGKFPNRRRKAKRVLEAQAPMAIPTPDFQPQAPSVGGDVAGQSNQETEPSRLEVQDSQPTYTNTPISFNDLSSLGYGSQLSAAQNLLGQGLDLSHSADGANSHGYLHAPDYPNPANFLPPSGLDPSHNIINNSRYWSFMNNLSDHSYSANIPGHFNGMNFFHPAQYGAIYGGQTTGGSVAPGDARSYTNLQQQGDSLPNHPVNAPMQRRKRPRAAPVKDEAESSDNRRSKRARTEAPVEAPQETSPLDFFAGGEGSLLRFDENGFVIQNNTPGTQAQDEALYPAVFDEFLHATQHGEHTAEDDAAQETSDASAPQGSNDEPLDTPVPLPAQGQKRRRSPSHEDVEDVDEGPKPKRLRTEEEIQTPGDSVDNHSEEHEAAPVQISRGQKRGRGSSESREETDTAAASPPAKRQKTNPSPYESTTSDGNESTTTNDTSNDDEASESSHHSSSSGDSDEGSEYTPSPYHQTSLKTIARLTTGGKGPYNANGRPVTGGKGKGPLKSSRRANIARKTPAKKQ